MLYRFWLNKFFARGENKDSMNRKLEGYTSGP